MKITIEIIHHNQQRYNTVGDWQFDSEGNLNIKVSETGDKIHNQLIAIHELIEALTCETENIAAQLVDSFDMNYTGSGEPGDDYEAPYFFAHQAASAIERVFAAQQGVIWPFYESVIEVLTRTYKCQSE